MAYARAVLPLFLFFSTASLRKVSNDANAGYLGVCVLSLKEYNVV